MTEITIIKIVDRNSFDKVLMTRAFTDADLAQAFGVAQVEKIIEELKAKGEDLLDIEAQSRSFGEDDVDDVEPVSGYQWRS